MSQPWLTAARKIKNLTKLEAYYISNKALMDVDVGNKRMRRAWSRWISTEVQLCNALLQPEKTYP